MHNDKKRRAVMAVAVICVLAPCLIGCTETDPLTMPGRWQPGGVNEANLAAEMQNPADLFQGRPLPGADGQEAAAAVERFRRGIVKPLPDVGLAEIKLGHDSGPQAAAVSGLGGY